MGTVSVHKTSEDFTPTQNANLATGIRTVAKFARCPSIAGELNRTSLFNLDNARIEVEKIIGRGKGDIPIDIPFTPRAKHSMELAVEECRQLGINYVEPEHLLLGILKEGAGGTGRGVAIRVLLSLGVDAIALEQQLRHALT